MAPWPGRTHMGHHITGIIARREVLASLDGELAGQPCYALSEGWAFLPLDENLDNIAGYDGKQVDGYLYLNDGLIALLRLASRRGDCAYIETHYVGGAGDQGAAVFRQGELLSSLDRRHRGPINEALHTMGFTNARPRLDAFEQVGLATYRENEAFRERGVLVKP